MSDYQRVAVHPIDIVLLGNDVQAEGFKARSVAITSDQPEFAAVLACALSAAGFQASVVAEAPRATDALIVTAGLVFDQTRLPVSCLPAGPLSSRVLDAHWASLVQARWLHRAGARTLVLLQDTAGCFQGGPSRGWGGGVAALARTAAREWPQVQVRCIDVPVDAAALGASAARVIDALHANEPVIGVDHAGRMRTLRSGIRLEAPRQKPEVAAGTWLISGGARGVTATCVQALARRIGGRFALFGRQAPVAWPEGIERTTDLAQLRTRLAVQAREREQPLRPAELDRQAREALAGEQIRGTLAALQAIGAQAEYYPCDVSCADQTRATVECVQNDLGPITGLVHGAGVLADRLIVDKTRDDLKHVFNTKVGGLANLLDALAPERLTHIALFSSAAAFFGNPGQADYAMANEIMNRVARSLAGTLPGVHIKAFNWGPWDGGMVSPELARHFSAQGIGLIAPAVGARLFVNELLDGNPTTVELLVGDPWPAR